MTLIDIDRLLAPCGEAYPCGHDLEYSPDYIDLMQMAVGSPDIQYGSMKLDAVEPDWREIGERAQALMGQSHDLRLALLLTRALLARHGLQGLATGLELSRRLIEQDWAQLYPRLDADDDYDPTERINILAELCSINTNSIFSLLRRLPVIEPSGLDPVTLHALQLASDPQRATSFGGPSLENIAGMFASLPFAPLAEIADLLDRNLALARQIEQTVGTLAGEDCGIDLSAFDQLLSTAQRFFDQQLPLHPHRPDDRPPAMAADDDAPRDAGGPRREQAPLRQASDGEIRNRADVVLALEQLCDYYAHHEPSSPLPLLLLRAIKLVDMSFIDIIGELAPSGLAEVQYLSGIRHPVVSTENDQQALGADPDY